MDNILLKLSPGASPHGLSVKLSDFGLSKVLTGDGFAGRVVNRNGAGAWRLQRCMHACMHECAHVHAQLRGKSMCLQLWARLRPAPATIL